MGKLRPVHIRRDLDGKLLAVIAAPSLKDALVSYYKDTLAPKGWRRPVYKGNVLSVVFNKIHATYTATEAK